MELGCIPQKMDEPSLGFHGLSRLVSKNIVSDVPWNDYFFSYCIKKMFFFKLTEGYPHDRCRRTMRKTYFAIKTNGIRWCSSKKGWIVFNRMSFSSSPKVTPTTGVAEQWKKTALQWKPMELGGVPQKWMNLPLVFMAFTVNVKKSKFWLKNIGIWQI